MKTKYAKVAKIAISLPLHTFDEIEHFRKEMHRERSAIILEAIMFWLTQKHREVLEARYAQGYKKKPERVADVEALYRAGLGSFTQEKW